MNKSCNCEELESRVLLAAYGTTTALSFNVPAGGVAQTGFTAVLPTTNGTGLVASNISIGRGQLRLTSTWGDNWTTRDRQDNALNVAINGGNDFQVETRLTSFPFVANWQNAGVFVAIDEDNYVNLVAGYSGQKMLQFGSEIGGAFTSGLKPITFKQFSSLDLRVTGTFATKQVAFEYRFNSDLDTAWRGVGLINNASIFTSSAKAGVSTMHYRAVPVTTSFNWFTAKYTPVSNPPPPPPPAQTVVTIGMNLDGIAEYSPIAPFIDLTTMFRPWGTVAKPYEVDPSIPRNADNYPLADAGTMTYANAYPDGDYAVSYEGAGSLAFMGLNAQYTVTSSSGGITKGILHIEPQSNPGSLSMMVTGVNAANPLHNLHIISPDADFKLSDTFRPVFLQKLAPFNGYLRMMDWMQTNDNPMITWSDRASPTRFSYVGPLGVPYEVLIKLANTTKKDLWINLPVMADDDFVRRTARLMRDNLATDRKVYVEYANEIWGYWSKVDAIWNLNKAKKDPEVWKTDDWGRSAQEYGKRSAQIANLFKEEYGTTAWNNRVRPVIGVLVAGYSWGDIALQFVKDKIGDPKTIFTGGMGIAHYVATGSDFGVVDDANLTLDKLFAWSNNWVDTKLKEWLIGNKNIASKFGLPAMHAYEGGQALVATNGMNENLKRQAQDDPRMAALYEHMVHSWYSIAGAGSIWGAFSLANKYTQYGFWGALQSITQPTSVKYEALKGLIGDVL